MEGHNTWIANHEGSTLVIPIGDLAQHTLSALSYYTVNRYPIYDDIDRKQIPGIDKYENLVDTKNAIPLTFLEQYCISELTTELSTSCYAGMLLLQAMGLGGWLYHGIDRHAVLGASGDPNVPGIGFGYDTNDRWSIPNPTGLTGVFEGYCLTHYKDMREAVEALVKRKFAQGGAYNLETPGAWKDSAKVRSSAKPFTNEIKDV
jgi:hypothetical protein